MVQKGATAEITSYKHSPTSQTLCQESNSFRRQSLINEAIESFERKVIPFLPELNVNDKSIQGKRENMENRRNVVPTVKSFIQEIKRIAEKFLPGTSTAIGKENCQQFAAELDALFDPSSSVKFKTLQDSILRTSTYFPVVFDPDAIHPMDQLIERHKELLSVALATIEQNHHLNLPFEVAFADHSVAGILKKLENQTKVLLTETENRCRKMENECGQYFNELLDIQIREIALIGVSVTKNENRNKLFII